MNKRTIVGFVAVAVFICLYEWLVHMKLLEQLYISTAHAWRPQAEMQQYCQWGFIATILFSFMFVHIFACNYEGKGLTEGFRYGLLIGLLLSAPLIGSYAYLPIPISIVFAWVLAANIKCILSGLISASVFSKL